MGDDDASFAKGPLTLVLEHWAAAAALLGAMFVALRLAAVSYIDPETVRAVLSAQGTASVLAGTLTPVLWLLPLVVTLGLVAMASARAGHPSSRRFYWWAVASALSWIFVVPGAIAISLVPAALAAIVQTASIHEPARGGLNRITRKGISGLRTDEPGRAEPLQRPARPVRGGTNSDRSPDPGKGSALSLPLTILGVCAFLFAATVTPPWLPREHLTLDDGKGIDGYVLREDANYVPVLRHEDRTVILIPARNIEHRELCVDHDDEWNDTSILGLLLPDTDYAACS